MDLEKDLCTVFCENGVHLIRTPKGEILTGLIWTRVTDTANGDIPTVIVKMMVKIEDSIK